MIRESNLLPTVWLLTPATKTDGYGNAADDWANATQTPMPGAEILIPATRSGARASAADDTNTSSTREAGAVLIMAGYPMSPMTDVNVSSRFLDADGRVWRVAGEVNIKRGQHAASTHLTVPLHFASRGAPRA